MRTFAKLFGRSPFVPLANHMDRVAACVDRTDEMFNAFKRGDFDDVERLAATISSWNTRRTRLSMIYRITPVERIFVYLQIISAAFVAFAHGANDVANAIGPLAAVAEMAKSIEKGARISA